MTLRQRGRILQARRGRYLRANPLCEECQRHGRFSVACEVDHVIPLHKGGADDFDTNGQALCLECHKVKTANDLGHRVRPVIGLDGYPVQTA